MLRVFVRVSVYIFEGSETPSMIAARGKFHDADALSCSPVILAILFATFERYLGSWQDDKNHVYIQVELSVTCRQYKK